MAGNGSDRTEGIDFTEINAVFERIDYPIDRTELVAEYGSHSVARTNAEPITVGELLDGTGDDSYESPEEIRQSLLNLMPSESVGRERYSDRGGIAPDADQDGESL